MTTRYKPIDDLNLQVLRCATTLPLSVKLAELTKDIPLNQWVLIHDGTAATAKRIADRTSGTLRARYKLRCINGQVWVTAPTTATTPAQVAPKTPATPATPATPPTPKTPATATQPSTGMALTKQCTDGIITGASR